MLITTSGLGVSSMSNVLRILITGAGAPGIKGTMFALKNNPDKTSIYTVGVDIDDQAVGRYFVDNFYKVPRPEDDAYLEKLCQICDIEDIDVIIPQTTRELSVLSRGEDSFTDLGIKVMVSDPQVIDMANNKLKLLQMFHSLGLPHPEYHLVTNCEELISAVSSLDYPKQEVVVKPPVSNGMRGLRILKECAWNVDRFLSEKPNGVEISLEELIQILERGEKWPELIVTEYLPGVEYSVDAFRGKTIQVAIPRVRDKILNGISFANTIELRDDVIEYTLVASEHLNLHYTFGFQFKLDSYGIPKLLECNPRVQGTMVASVFSGVNVIWLGVKEALGEEIKELPPLRQPVYFRRIWGGVGIVDGKSVEI